MGPSAAWEPTARGIHGPGSEKLSYPCAILYNDENTGQTECWIRRAETNGSLGTMDVHYDEGKLTELTLYVARQLETDRPGGATKLNKVLYFSDFAHLRRTGQPITGAEYQKLPQGPAPRRLLPIRNSLIERGEAEIRRETYLGYEQHRLIAKRDPDMSIFDADELESVNRVLEDLAHLTAAQVSALSHAEPGWQLVEDGEAIPYEAALIAPEQIQTPTSRKLAAEIAERYGIPART